MIQEEEEDEGSVMDVYSSLPVLISLSLTLAEAATSTVIEPIGNSTTEQEEGEEEGSKKKKKDR